MKAQFTLLTLGLSLAAGWGQARVDFRNVGVTFPTPADRLVYLDRVGGQKLVGTNYVAGLWFTPGFDPTMVDGRLAPEFGQQAGVPFPFRPPTTSQPGGWFVPSGQSAYVTLDGIVSWQDVMLQVRVWDSAKFLTFTEAFASGEFAASEPFSYLAPPPSATPDQFYMDNLRAFSSFMLNQAIWINDLVASEGSNGVAQATFTVTMHPAQAQPVSVHYATEDGTARAGEDYVASSGTLVFAPGELKKTITVTLTPDVPPESEETFYVRLSEASGAVLGKELGACLITEIRVDGISVDTSIRFHTVLNRRYGVERSGNAIDWEPVLGATNVLGTGGMVTVVDRGSGCEGLRVYRAKLIE